ncbi:hypothetical protein ACFYZ4_27815 [Streptomyces sp. NPDC001513]|uniref:hypothetical protein n=1 Tax=Streptomyces sp. NPDC001513 TaxID=3364580 RepID=UPI0036A1EF45
MTPSSRRLLAALLCAVGCSLVAVTIGILIRGARVRQIGDAARASATARLIGVRRVYELTGRVDCRQLPAPLRAEALAGQRSTYLDLSGPDPVVWAARPAGGEHVLSVRLSPADDRAELAEPDRQPVAYGVSVVALAAMGGALPASRLSRDLRTAAETAREPAALGCLGDGGAPAGLTGARAGRPSASGVTRTARTARTARMAARAALTCGYGSRVGRVRAHLTGHQQARGGRGRLSRKHDPVSSGESPCADVPHTC